MAAIIKEWKDSYDVFLKENADHRTKDWFLLWSDPRPVWIMTVLYLGFVWLGPKYMKNRKAFSLSWFMVIYNLGLVGLSTYMFVEILLSTINAEYNLTCAVYNEETKKDPRELRVANVLWWYFFSKAIEFTDTVLMILRKNNRQVSFLHVFHHAIMLNIWWWVMMFIPGGLSWFGAWLNCLVHCVMYAYYGLSAIPALRGKLWWKRYITRFQLIQFCITLTHTVISLSQEKCDFPVWGQYLLVSLMVCMLILFSNFYLHAYVLSKRKAKQDAYTNGKAVQSNGNHASNGTGTTNGTGPTTRRRGAKKDE